MSLLWRGKGEKIRNPKLGGGNSNIIYFHPEPWGNDLIWLIFFGFKPPTRKTLRQLFGMIFGQIIATSNHRTDFPQKGSWWRETPFISREIRIGEIVYLVWPDDLFQGGGVGDKKWPQKKASEWVAWGWICGKLQPPTKSLAALLKVSTGVWPAGLAMSPCRCLGNGFWEMMHHDLPCKS